MSFQNNPDIPIEYYLIEVAELMSVREGIARREAHLKLLETMSEWLGYYEAALTAKSAYFKFKGGV